MSICSVCKKEKGWIHSMAEECRESVNSNEKNRTMTVYGTIELLHSIIHKYEDKFKSRMDFEDTLNQVDQGFILDKPIVDRSLKISDLMAKEPKEVIRISQQARTEQFSALKTLVEEMETKLHKEI